MAGCIKGPYIKDVLKIFRILTPPLPAVGYDLQYQVYATLLGYALPPPSADVMYVWPPKETDVKYGFRPRSSVPDWIKIMALIQISDRPINLSKSNQIAGKKRFVKSGVLPLCLTNIQVPCSPLPCIPA